MKNKLNRQNVAAEHGARFTKKERRGIFALCLLFAISMSFHFLQNSKALQTSHELTSFKNNASDQSHPFQDTDEAKTAFFIFDPNTIDYAGLQTLGIPEKAVQNIIRYREKGGKFRKPEDLSKIYSMPSQVFEALRPYIKISEKKKEQGMAYLYRNPMKTFTPPSAPLNPNNMDSTTLYKLGFRQSVASRWHRYLERGGKFRNQDDLLKIWGTDTTLLEQLAPYWLFPMEEPITSSTEKTDKTSIQKERNSRQFLIDVNGASEAEWQYLPGIGPAYASRIVKYREKLGGFHDISQLKEIYGMPDSVVQKIRPHLSLETGYQQLRINKATKEELAAHPYFSFKDAELICNYRTHHGPYKQADDLLKIKVLHKEWIDKILPYIIFD